MKKAISFLLAVLMLFSAAGCAVEPEIIDNSAVLSPVTEPDKPEKDGIIISAIEPSSESTSSEESSSESSSNEESSSSSSGKAESSSSSSSQTSSLQSSSQSSQSSTSSENSSESSSSSSESSSESESKDEDTSVSVSFEETRAVWISYLEYQSIMQGKSKSQFKSNIKNMFANLAEDGFNTVFVHVRSHSDAMYDSDIYPWSVYCTGTEGQDPGYDPLAIMVEEAHSAGLKIEAWINPYRIKGTSDTSKIAASSPAYEWLDTGKVVVMSSGIYYNPADEEVINLVVSGVEEIVRNYDVDGIHFDDYFYPTTAESFDSEYYSAYRSAGGRASLAEWRRQNVNTLIKKVYSSIKAIDDSCRFGVSPTGNTSSNYNELYCDVYTWVTSKGYIDYICPQLYYGFNNKSKPYLDVLSEFSNMITRNDVELIVGLAAYKSGTTDNYAGTGKSEWLENTDVLARQVTAARKEEKYAGFSLYRYDSLYNPSSSTRSYIANEIENLKDIL